MNLRTLPESPKNVIEVARLKAERQFRDDEKQVLGYTKPYVYGAPCSRFQSGKARTLLVDRVVAEVLEVAREVCVSARNGEVKARDMGTHRRQDSRPALSRGVSGPVEQLGRPRPQVQPRSQRALDWLEWMADIPRCTDRGNRGSGQPRPCVTKGQSFHLERRRDSVSVSARSKARHPAATYSSRSSSARLTSDTTSQ